MRKPPSKPRTPHRKRTRNYQDEYRRRIEKGLKVGKSRSAARGHPRAADLPKPDWGAIDRNLALEKALAQMRRGWSQQAAAMSQGVTVERLRRHRLLHTTSKREGRRWIIADTRPQGFYVVSDGKMISVTLANDAGSDVSRHWHAVNDFLESNDDEYLHPFEGEGVTDVHGRFHKFETRPNVLRKLESLGDLSFLEIYADVA